MGAYVMERPNLVIIHGWTYTIEPWKRTVELLEAGGVRVIQLRVPGLTTPSEEVWTIDGYVSWLEQELKSIDRPIVLGHSNGGRIAMHYLRSHPDAFRALILLNSAGVEIAPTALSAKRRLLRGLAKLLAPLKYIPGIKKIVYRLLGSDYGRAPKNMQATLRNMLESDKDFSPSGITTPTTILWGEADTTTPLAMGRKIAAALPHACLMTFANWKHAPYISHPDELAAAIVEAIGVRV
jgi:pimeloyl-ACP methyl ester carboxylesterase